MTLLAAFGLILFMTSLRVALTMWREREQRSYWRGALVAVLPMTVGGASMMFVRGQAGVLIMLACFACQMIGVAMIVFSRGGVGPRR
jgi:hypothetical protein